MRDLDLRRDLVVIGDDPEHVDGPALRVLALNRDEVIAAGDALPAGWPIDDRVLGEKLGYAVPVPVLDPVPQRPDHFRRFRGFHGSILLRQPISVSAPIALWRIA